MRRAGLGCRRPDGGGEHGRYPGRGPVSGLPSEGTVQRIARQPHRRPRKPRMTTTMTTAPTSQMILFIAIFLSLFEVGPRPPPDLSVGQQIMHRLRPHPR
jgi:hypothetical protein